ncbi:radical SAM domain containing protein [Acanthamoeba castellanii str. Neff]|uniref:Radical SAM domain containing protein n=1 Tax=Acanthamoeba castellanii (strain ATCC 30010 / Neff) TaxID=1257118 RepID=L8H759_ACACF|nr:radical SAM domain containing protein [Acanthamoeba castellanii str. Neff]ELR20975.1 radical SAM domain containing protein [Acanthamoeba castellanii str. Neff]
MLLRRGLHDAAPVSGGSTTDLHKLLYSPLLTPDAPAAEDPVAARNALQAALSRGGKKRPVNRLHLPLEEKIAPLASLVGRALTPGEPLTLEKEQIVHILQTADEGLENALYDYADTVTQRYFGKKIYFRGIVEFSNVCTKDCYYCGIRKHIQVKRYSMSKEEIVNCAIFAYESGYGSLMLQSGELPTDKRLAFLVDTIKEVKRVTIEKDKERNGVKEGVENKSLGVAISLGELTKDMFRSLREAGAHRYLLRIESSNPDLYAKLHPADHSWHRRVECLRELNELGFQVGTGVMIGLPGQTLGDLAQDLLFFKSMDIDMIGMGPYICQKDTPLGKLWQEENSNLDTKRYNEKLFRLSTKMVALARIICGDVNIAATTALQAINPQGREVALNQGANMLMPILTPRKYREDYQLYEGKPCIDEGAEECRSCLKNRVQWAGKELTLHDWGDPQHFFSRQNIPTPTRQ